MKQLHPLGRLISEIRTVNRWSLEDVARRIQQHGIQASRSWVGSLINDPVTSVSVRQVEAVAAGLGLPRETVLTAFLESMGYTPPGRENRSVEDAIRGDGRLSSDEQQLLIDLVRLARKRRKAVDAPEPEV